MDNPVLVQVLYARKQLLQILDSLSLRQPPLLHYIIKELSSFSVLHDQMYAFFGLDDLDWRKHTS